MAAHIVVRIKGKTRKICEDNNSFQSGRESAVMGKGEMQISSAEEHGTGQLRHGGHRKLQVPEVPA